MWSQDMAAAPSKKDRLIEEAQRLAGRGQLDKAAKAYEQALALEPSAITIRQKLAELLVRAGRSADARSEFETIGKYYAGHGFYLKAIAVYKQLQKLFPQDITVTMTLAELNERHGLVGNALAEYKQVFEYYERSSNAGEALNVLARMQDVDPSNVNIKLKLAESYFQAGKTDESYATFVRLASLLQERGDAAALFRLNTRIQQLFPEKTTFMLEVLAEQVAGGNAAGAVTGIQALLRNNPNDKRTWELMVAAYRALNQPERLKAVYHHYLKFFPDDVSPRKGLLECLVAERDVTGVLALLDRCEQDLMRAGAVADLVGVYKGLEEIDPINPRVLEGLKRILETAGDQDGAKALDSRLASFKALSAKPVAGVAGKQPGEADRVHDAGVAPVGTPEAAREEVPGIEPAGVVPEEGAAEGSLFDAVLSEADVDGSSGEDEFEIEIEIDNDVGFENVEVDFEPIVALGDNWHDTVSAAFDGISVAQGSVKFGSELDTSDARSHYDLGMAFREMGLYDEAINEFRHAAADPVLRMKCLVLQGGCLRDKGDATTAESLLRSLLKPGLSLDDVTQASTGRRIVVVSLLKPGLSLEDTLFTKYELALTCQLTGKDDEAAKLFAEIDGVNPGFRDVLARLDAGTGASLDFSDEDLQGFDLK